MHNTNKNWLTLIVIATLASAGIARADEPAPETTSVPNTNGFMITKSVNVSGDGSSTEASASASATSGTAKASTTAAVHGTSAKSGKTATQVGEELGIVHPLKPAVTKAATPPKANPARRSHAGGSSSSANANVTVRMPTEQLKELIESVAAMKLALDGRGGHDAALEARIAATEKQIADLRKDLNTINEKEDKDIEAVYKEFNRHNEVASSVDNNHERRLRKLEAGNPFGHALTLHADFLALSGPAHHYTGVGLGAEVALALSDTSFLWVSPSLLMGAGKNPFSATLGLGGGVTVFEKKNVAGAIKFGVTGAALAIDNSLNAYAIDLLGTLGFQALVSRHLYIGLDGLLGPGFSNHQHGGNNHPKAAGGGAFRFGGTF
ncbi:MAG: hypothetical protein RLZZ324_860 [Candidatus Parcubacteria bacterium]|jgi:hypothetical protein